MEPNKVTNKIHTIKRPTIAPLLFPSPGNSSVAKPEGSGMFYLIFSSLLSSFSAVIMADYIYGS